MGDSPPPTPPDAVPTATGGPRRPAEQSEYLLCIEGERSWRFTLPRSGEVVIGRGTEAGLRLADELVSRTHACILAVPDGTQLTDLDSRHGTLVNGQRLMGSRLLGSGDVITLGNAVLIVHRPARSSSGRRLIDGAALLRRLEEEIERSLRYRRKLCLLVLRSGAPLDVAWAAGMIGPRLRLIDAAAVMSECELAVLLPELGVDEAAEVGLALVAALGPAAAPLGAGMAASPADACDAESVWAGARAAAAEAGAGQLVMARDAVRRLTLGEREVVLADPAMVRLYDLIKRLARSDLPILIQGETGVGKELAAAAVHTFSSRAAGPFVSINCAAIPEHLAESELFGHERGAFTGAVAAKPGVLEVASGGTVFLDEIGDLPIALQGKLLRVLETGELTRVGEVKVRTTDIRVVAATNRDLEADIAADRFRRDLFFRLGAAQVMLPPLRDRPRDVALLAGRALVDACAKLGRSPLSLSIAATQALALHTWPGNVRELRNALEYAAAAAPDTSTEVDPWHLPGAVTATPVGAVAGDAAPVTSDPTPAARLFRPIEEEIESLERRRMVEALVATKGTQTRAAELIDMPLRTFVTKLKRYAISASDWE